MAKDSEFIGEYIVTIHDNGSVEVSRIYKSTMAALREIAALKGMEVKETWFAHALGRNILKEYCNGEKSGTIGEYTIEREDNNRINVIRTYSNTKAGLRECSETIGFEYDDSWNTQHFGRELIKFIKSKKS